MAGATKILACDVINQAVGGNQPVTDKDILASCPKCGKVALSDCIVSQDAETTYVHMRCGNVLLVISAPNPDGKPWPGRGYRIGDFVLRNPVDLTFRGGVINASPNALAEARDE